MQKFELFPQETESTLDSPYTVEPYSSIKLFGKTVLVRDTPKQSLEVVENSESSLGCGVNEKSESNGDIVVQGLSSNNLDSQVAFGFVSDSGTPPCVPPNPVANIYCQMDNVFAMPWYTWYRGPMYPYPLSCEKIAAELVADSPLKEELKLEENPREGYLVGSNSGLTGGINADSRNSDAVELKHMFSPGKESSKGFVPYKRCLTERDDKSSISLLQGREGRRARVCS